MFLTLTLPLFAHVTTVGAIVTALATWLRLGVKIKNELCTLRYRMKSVNMLSLWSPETLFQAFNHRPTQKPQDLEMREPDVHLCILLLPYFPLVERMPVLIHLESWW